MNATNKNMKSFSEFFKIAEKLKVELRHSYTSDKNRQESVAEHTWFMSFMALLFFHEADPKIDQLKTLKMIILHDIAEAIFGDIPAFEKSERKNNKQQLEREAMETLLAAVPSDAARAEIKALWEEYEETQTAEAKYAKAIDKIEVLIQHNISDLSTWGQGDYGINPYYRQDLFVPDADKFLQDFKKQIDRETMEKIEAAGELTRVSPEHLKRWEEEKNNL